MSRRRYLDEATPSDNTYNSIRPVARQIQVKRKDTPARRQKEQRKAEIRRQQARVTPENPRQASIGPYRQKTAIDKAGGRLYAAAEQKEKDAQDREAAGVVLNALFKPIMPSTYIDMYDAYKQGEVNNVTDALAAPYVTGSWSQRNPGKALATDIVAPFALSKAGKLARFAGNDIANSWRNMRYQLAHPESQVLGITPDATIPSGFRYSPEELSRIRREPNDIFSVIVNNLADTRPSNAIMNGYDDITYRNLGSQANSHFHDWLRRNNLNSGNATRSDILRYINEYDRAPYNNYTVRNLEATPVDNPVIARMPNIEPITFNQDVVSGTNVISRSSRKPRGRTMHSDDNINTQVSDALSNQTITIEPTYKPVTSLDDAENRLERFYSNFAGEAPKDEFDALVDYLRANKAGFNTDAEQQYFYNLGQRYGVDPVPMFRIGSVASGRGKVASKVPILKEARRRKQVVADNMAKGMTKAEAEAAERSTRQNIYFRNKQNKVIDFANGPLTREQFNALPDEAKGGRSYNRYIELYNTLGNPAEDTMTSTYVRNDWGTPGSLTGLDIGRFIEEAPHGERINIHSLSTDSYPAILNNLLKYGDKGKTGIKLQLHPTTRPFNSLGRETYDGKYITTYDDIVKLTDKVNKLYNVKIPYPIVKNGMLRERPEFTVFKFKNGGIVKRRTLA